MSNVAVKTGLVVAAFAIPSQALAETVTFSTTTTASCTITLSTGGSLAPSSEGTELGSEQPGGSAATISLLAVGNSPTVRFGTPNLTAPTGDSGSIPQIKYSSLGGASQNYTSSETTTTPGVLVDTFTVDAKVTNTGGFQAGTYSVSTEVTCEQ